MRGAVKGFGALLVGLAIFACGTTDDSSSGKTRRPGSGSGGGAGKTDTDAGVVFSGAGGSNGQGGSGFSLGGSDGRTLSDGGKCVAEITRAEQLPLDIYVMFDTSFSMSDPVQPSGMRMDAVRGALVSFLNAPETQGISVGIGYFGDMPIVPQPTTSCNPADYADASVGIAPLPGNIQPITDSLNVHGPTGETPTGPAIRGACTYARDWKAQHPADVVVILLVTDGVPEAPLSAPMGCNPTLPDAVQAASECAGVVPQIPIYVLGVGAALQNLTQIAQAGGTQQAYLVESGNVSDQVLQALNAIRGAAMIPCEFQVPPAPAGEQLDYELVNVQFRNETGTESTIYYVGDASRCDPNDGGWFYDNPSAPTKILLCTGTCDVVVTQPLGQVGVALGCTRITR